MPQALDKPAAPPVAVVHPEDDLPMTVLEHLGELRGRLIKALLGVLPGMFIAWGYRDNLLEFLFTPFADAYVALKLGKPVMHFSNPPELFMVQMKIAIVAGLMFSSPWVFYQVWAFVAPGLYRRERRFAIPFVVASTVCFACGAFFAYKLFMGPMYEALLGMGGLLPGGAISIEPMMMITENISFATQVLLAFGVVFEVPVVVTFLALAGIVNWRQLLSFGRWWVVISSLLAAVLTPTADAVSMMIMMAPMVILYFLAVGLAFLFGPKLPAKSDDSAGVT
ncbi:MAG TPA: twin-arginine translocase subunit TatC [Polyangiales bacterium]|jgi:sec-independent protein translocase protein TatC